MRTHVSAHWWWGFGLLIAAPALILAVLGFRSIKSQEADRARRFDEQVRQLALSLDTALDATLSRMETDLARRKPGRVQGPPWFTLDDSGNLLFPDDKVFFSDSYVYPLLPLEVRQAADEALAAEAQSDYPRALDAYRKSTRYRELSVWARLGAARITMRQQPNAIIELLNLLQRSDGDSLSPDGTPVALLAAGYIEKLPKAQSSAALFFLKTTLSQLRSGHWWLNYQQRKLYDAELTELIPAMGGSPPMEDPRLGAIAAAETVSRRALPFRRGSPTIGFADSVLLVVNSEPGTSGRWRGLALSGSALSTVAGEALGPLSKTVPFAIGIDASERTSWGDVRVAKRRVALASVPGWQMVADDPPGDVTRRERGLWYGLLGLLVSTMIFGLTMTGRFVRREAELARVQAEFAAGVTHEFKSPLTGLRLLMERISSGRLISQESLREYLNAMRRETDRLDHLVNRLLETHRIQSGQKQYQIAPHCVTDIAQTAVARLRTQAESKHIELRIDSDDLTREIDVDRTALQDSFENLLENAVKYSPPGTPVTLSIRHGVRDLLVTVRDEGTGIDSADLPHIFDRFYRGHRASAQSIPGTGLGLALVKAVAEGHGGTVEVESTNRGSEFRLRIPIREEDTYATGLDRG
jgi:signal transduction histidine kinase